MGNRCGWLFVPHPGYPLFEFLSQLDDLEPAGHFFSFESEGYLVISLLPRSEVFDEGSRGYSIVNQPIVSSIAVFANPMTRRSKSAKRASWVWPRW